LEGNKRYVSGVSKKKDFDAQRDEQRKGQHPYAIILTCADSRVPPEIIFDEDLGKLFVIRVAGNVIDEVTLGSIEYAAEHLNTQLLVIMGHSSCGAVKATLDGGDFGHNINALVDKIKPAVNKAKGKSKDKNMQLALAIEGNVELQADNCIRQSKILQELIHLKKFKITGAIYSIENGAVTIFEPDAKPSVHQEHTSEPAKEGEEKNNNSEQHEKTKENSWPEHSSAYLVSKDTNVQGKVYTDGKLFCVQVSSWKSKTKAEKEAAKLRKNNKNVFIVEYENPRTKEISYRVRVGNFPSVFESEKFLTLLK